MFFLFVWGLGISRFFFKMELGWGGIYLDCVSICLFFSFWLVIEEFGIRVIKFLEGFYRFVRGTGFFFVF